MDITAAVIMERNPHSAASISILSWVQLGPRHALNGCWMAIAPSMKAVAMSAPPRNDAW